jgi:mannose-6-phosphate isomerase-like protein (cupin superfamily)
MRTISTLSISILVFIATNVSAQQTIVRRELYKANIGTQQISTVDVREIVFKPKQMTGVHRHPCPVISYVVEGAIKFQIRGQKMQIIHAGQVCYEPPGAIIEHFDNASDRVPPNLFPTTCSTGKRINRNAPCYAD